MELIKNKKTMKQTDILVRILTSDEGHVLTEADETITPENRALATEVVLADTDSPDNWKEITAEEAATIRKARCEAFGVRLAREKDNAIQPLQPT